MDGSMRALPFAVIDVPEWAAGGPNAAAGCCLQPLVTRRRAMRGALCVSKNGTKSRKAQRDTGNFLGNTVRWGRG